jgi:hypothetical protein
LFTIRGPPVKLRAVPVVLVPRQRLLPPDDSNGLIPDDFPPKPVGQAGTVVAPWEGAQALTRSLPVRTKLQCIALLLPVAALSLPVPAAAQWVYPPPYPGYVYARPESNLRLNVKPKEASVYVDGYFAGKVEEFDGQWQRLHVVPGQHEIIVYLEGYRSLKQKLYLGPNATRTMTGKLEKLAAGEEQEAEPQPEPDVDRRGPPIDAYRVPPDRAPMPMMPPGPTDQPPPGRGPRTAPGEPSRYASLSIRVQPGGGALLIDGERWDGPTSDDERLIVQVPEGRHTIEVDRDGYDRFTTEVDVRRGETTPVNIALRRR